MKLTPQPTNKVNVLRLSDVHNSGWLRFWVPNFILSAAFGNADPLKEDESGHSKTEGLK